MHMFEQNKDKSDKDKEGCKVIDRFKTYSSNNASENCCKDEAKSLKGLTDPHDFPLDIFWGIDRNQINHIRPCKS